MKKKNIKFYLLKKKENKLLSPKLRLMIYGVIFMCLAVVIYSVHPGSNLEHMVANDLKIAKSLYFVVNRENLLSDSAFSSFLSKILLKDKEVWIVILPDYQSCQTPWGYPIPHWESVLAYQQDLNTPNVCFTQRRSCFDGKLSGTFTLQSCKENENFTYLKENFVVYNDPDKKRVPIDEEKVQTIENTNDNLSNWLIWANWWVVSKPQSSISKWNSNEISNATPLEQTERPSVDCKSPWWEWVKDGQFVKAYQRRYGSNDVPCEVQLRRCVVWKLEWMYQYEKCEFRSFD